METEQDQKNPLMMLWIYGALAVFLISYPSTDMTWWKALLISLLWPIASIAEFLGIGPSSSNLCH
jgi:hypothetical protein